MNVGPEVAKEQLASLLSHPGFSVLMEYLLARRNARIERMLMFGRQDERPDQIGLEAARAAAWIDAIDWVVRDSVRNCRESLDQMQQGASKKREAAGASQ